MKNIAVTSLLMWGMSLDEMFQTLKEYDIKSMELWAEQFDYFNFDIEEYKALASRDQVETVIHCKSWDLNFSSVNKTIREASITEVKASIDLARALDATSITVHPSRETAPGIDTGVVEKLRDGLKEISKYAKECNVEISLEIMEKIPKELITSDTALFEVLGDMVNDFKYTLDIAHCLSEEEIFQYLDTIPNIDKLHITNKKGPKLHTDIDDGDFDFYTLLPKLYDLGIPMVLEGVDKSKENIKIGKSIKMIKEILSC